MSEMTIAEAFIALALCALLGIGLVMLARLVNKKTPGTKMAAVMLWPGMCITLISIATAIVLIMQVHIAKAHGMYSYDIPVMELPNNIAHSPKDQSAEFDMEAEHKNTIVMLYRFTCHDCEAVHEQFNAELDSLPYEHYWISSRSEVGQKLREMYNINEVPTMIAFDINGRASVAKAYTYDDAGNPMVDRSAVDIAMRNLDYDPKPKASNKE